MPAERCLSVVFRGSHESAPEQYVRLNEYMAEHELEPTDHSRGITLIDEGLTSDRGKFVTEIKIPVKRIGKRSVRNNESAAALCCGTFLLSLFSHAVLAREPLKALKS